MDWWNSLMKHKEGYVGKSAYQNLEVRTARPGEATLPRKASRIFYGARTVNGHT